MGTGDQALRTVDLDALARYYDFPDTIGRGQRLAFVELAGGYHPADLERAFARLDPQPQVRAISVESRYEGMPISGENGPLDNATLLKILDALEQPGADPIAVADEFTADNNAWPLFLATAEVALDLQIAGQLANGAELNVYFAARDAHGIAAAITHAVADGASVISVSWGSPESSWSADNVAIVEAALSQARQRDITVVCATGDFGSGDHRVSPDGLARVNYPASSPHALAVGGTSIQLSDGEISGEIVWNSTFLGTPCASGGGASGLHRRPDYQGSTFDARNPAPDDDPAGIWRSPHLDSPFSGRAVPDVAAHADRADGYEIQLAGRSFVAAGTSAGAPLWCALLARVGERLGAPVGWINERLYSAASPPTRDITMGDNGLGATRRSFRAHAGWDATTGWGTPRGDKLVDVLGVPTS